MSSNRNWRDSVPYLRAKDLPAADLAWEFLRRNAEYRRAYASAMRASADAADLMAQRWGLRFRGGSSPGGGRDRSLLACPS